MARTLEQERQALEEEERRLAERREQLAKREREEAIRTIEKAGFTPSVSDTMVVTVDAVANGPNLSVPSGVTVAEATWVSLPISMSLLDTDGSESLGSVEVRSIPSNVWLRNSSGMLTPQNGKVVLTADAWNSLQIAAADDAEFNLEIAGTSVETDPTSTDTTVAVSSATTDLPSDTCETPWRT